jgi:hypothetical protein
MPGRKSSNDGPYCWRDHGSLRHFFITGLEGAPSSDRANSGTTKRNCAVSKMSTLLLSVVKSAHRRRAAAGSPERISSWIKRGMCPVVAFSTEYRVHNDRGRLKLRGLSTFGLRFCFFGGGGAFATF